MAVALTFTVAQAYSLNAPGRDLPFPIRRYEWLYVPSSLAFLVSFRFAEQPQLAHLPRLLRYAIAIPVGYLLYRLVHLSCRSFGQHIGLLPSPGSIPGMIAGPAAYFFGGIKDFLITIIVAVVYASVMRSRRAQMAFEAAALQRAASRRRVSATRLATQQARLDPAFLFSSLELVQTLYERDPDAAEATLANLIDYLRTALPKLGEEGSTLRREVDLASLYLEIVRARMGSRLVVDIEVPHDIEAASFPPMIVVPLVEHVLRHGLEPLPHGGRLGIRAARRAERLEVTVSHDGVAFEPTGAWLAPLRERLMDHYGDAARLTVTAAARGGTVTVNVPHESSLRDPASVARVALIGSTT